MSKMLCSRSFGFVAVFEKKENACFDWRLVEQLYGISCVESANKVAAQYRKNLQDVIETLYHKKTLGEKIVLWCANAVSSELMREYKKHYCSDCEWTIIDSDITKKEYFGNDPIVHTPDEAQLALRRCSAVIICSNSAAKAITRSIIEKDLTKAKLYYIEQNRRITAIDADKG